MSAETPAVGDWVWRVRLLSSGKAERGSSLFCFSMQEVADYIGAEEPDNTEGDGYALDRYQLKESDLPNGQMGEFDGF